MPIPPLNNHGLLPHGICDCSLAEIQGAFCQNAHRQKLFDGLMNFLKTEWYPLGIAAPIFVDGSFVRGKPSPDDIDLVLDVTGLGDKDVLATLKLRYRHDELKKKYKVDVWMRHPDFSGQYDLVSFFQYIGEKAAAELQLYPKHLKGILRIQS